MKLPSARIYLALLFAAAILASSFFLKGSPLNSLVVTALTGVGLTLVVLRRPVCGR